MAGAAHPRAGKLSAAAASVAAALGGSPPRASPRTRGAGGSYLKLSYTYFAASSRFTSSGARRSLADEAFLADFASIVRDGRAREHAAWIYGEAGVHERADLMARASLRAPSVRYRCRGGSCREAVDPTQGEAGETVRQTGFGVGDIDAGARVRVLGAPAVAVALWATLPVAYDHDRRRLRVLDDNLFNDRLPLGPDAWALEPQALAGVPLGRGFWAGAALGLRLRFGPSREQDYDDLLTYRAEGGGPIAGPASFRLAASGFVPAIAGAHADADEPPTEAQALGPDKVLYPSSEAAHEASAGVALALGGGLSLEAAARAVYAGRRTVAGWGMEAGVGWKR